MSSRRSSLDVLSEHKRTKYHTAHSKHPHYQFTTKQLEGLAIAASTISLASYVPIAVDIFLNPSSVVKITTYVVYTLAIGSSILWITFGVISKSKRIFTVSSVALSLVLFIFIAIIIFNCVTKPVVSTSLNG